MVKLTEGVMLGYKDFFISHGGTAKSFPLIPHKGKLFSLHDSDMTVINHKELLMVEF